MSLPLFLSFGKGNILYTVIISINPKKEPRSLWSTDIGRYGRFIMGRRYTRFTSTRLWTRNISTTVEIIGKESFSRNCYDTLLWGNIVFFLASYLTVSFLLFPPSLFQNVSPPILCASCLLKLLHLTPFPDVNGSRDCSTPSPPTHGQCTVPMPSTSVTL